MKNEPINEPIIRLEISGMKKRFSTPSLFVPKKNGKADITRRWYVSFYWRTNPEGKLDKKFKYYKGINRIKTVAERRRIGKSLAEAYHKALLRGWNPDTQQTDSNPRKKVTTVDAALNFALKLKLEHIKEATATDYTFRSGIFKSWLKTESLLFMPINELNVNHIFDFIDFLQLDYRKENGQKLSNNSIDNTRRVISALFTVLQNKRVISRNFVKDVPKLKSKAKKNKPFTPSELKAVREMLKKDDPYLIHFLDFMIYPVLRPREITRLKVGDVNTEDWLITVETKTKAFSISRIIEKMKPTITAMNLERVPKNYSLFSPYDKPEEWKTKRLDSKVMHFSKRFTKVIRKMGYDTDYTLYSVRHTAIWSLYNGLQQQGKNEREIIQNLMPITGHASEAGLRNYLRDIQVVIPPDYSEMFGFDF